MRLSDLHSLRSSAAVAIEDVQPLWFACGTLQTAGYMQLHSLVHRKVWMACVVCAGAFRVCGVST